MSGQCLGICTMPVDSWKTTAPLQCIDIFPVTQKDWNLLWRLRITFVCMHSMDALCNFVTHYRESSDPIILWSKVGICWGRISKDLAGLKRTGVLLNMKRREVQGAVMSVCGSARGAVHVALLVAAGTTTEGQGPPLNTQLSGWAWRLRNPSQWTGWNLDLINKAQIQEKPPKKVLVQR